ncbi:TetR/AcrR family transcriptional regulator [Rhizohabitans arisaemae]|uniref:TetR/AcrR family transcriptional regulator n=1 Tax=Rhizohabitans arisaemae TaxID=2720610 RepID=UPI0024B23055|nr:TetR/AcrR family transcriptional regulator [Rhizohabitans arisaemae]
MRSEIRKSPSFIEAARRAQIIAAAIETVAEVGYAQASLGRIARHAGISKSVISYHFADKDDLLQQVVRQVFDDSWAYLEPLLRRETTARGRLGVWITAELSYMAAHRAQFMAMVRIVENHRNAVGELSFADSPEESITELVKILRQGQRDGEFRGFAPRPIAVTVFQAITGALDEWARDPRIDLAAYAAELVTAFDLATRRDT